MLKPWRARRRLTAFAAGNGFGFGSLVFWTGVIGPPRARSVSGGIQPVAESVAYSGSLLGLVSHSGRICKPQETKRAGDRKTTGPLVLHLVPGVGLEPTR